MQKQGCLGRLEPQPKSQLELSRVANRGGLTKCRSRTVGINADPKVPFGILSLRWLKTLKASAIPSSRKRSPSEKLRLNLALAVA